MPSWYCPRSAQRYPIAAVLAMLLVIPAAAGASPSVRADIVGGQPAPSGAWPWTAFIEIVVSPSQTNICTGTVISAKLVLTAAHCAAPDAGGAPYPASEFRVVTGSLDWTDASVRQLSGVSQTAIYPSWNPTTRDDDVAILQLSTPTTAPAVPLASDPGDLPLTQPGSTETVAGWGITAPGDPTAIPDQLQVGSMLTQSPSYCSSQFSSFSSSDQLCATEAPAGGTVCQGDSGGPMLAQRSDGTWVEVAITSFGPQTCNGTAPAFFTRVDAVSSWIAGELGALTLPTVLSAPASDITSTTAQLNGQVNPNGTPTTTAFQYGTTTNYGSVTTTLPNGSGSTTFAVAQAIPGLLPATTYHYRLLATNGNGTVAGADETFTTAPAAPPVVASAPPARTHRTAHHRRRRARRRRRR